MRFKSWLEASGLSYENELATLEAAAVREVDEAVAFAEAGTLEPVEELTRFVTMTEVPE
ncbi:MAG: hypothetical protein ACSLE5_10060 [Porticoccaceae bacterium]